MFKDVSLIPVLDINKMNGGDIMKQGLVTKVEKNFMIVKTEDSDIERIKVRSNVQVGERISYTKKDIYKGFNTISYKQLTTSLSVLIVLALIGNYILSPFSNNEVFAVVSLDVNPGVKIEVNDDYEVLNIIGLPEVSSVIIPKDYKNKTLSVVFDEMIGLATENGYLATGDSVVISYVAMEETNKDIITDISDFILKESNRFTMVYIEGDASLLEEANDAEMTVGKKYLMDLLTSQGIEIVDSNQFIQNAVDALKEQLPVNDDGFIELDIDLPILTPIDDPSEVDETTEEDEPDTDADDENTDSTADEEDVSDDPVDEDPVDEDPVDEEDPDEVLDNEEAEKKAAAIEAQKVITNQTYWTYLNKKELSDEAELSIVNQEKLIANDQLTLDQQSDKYIALLEIEQPLLEEKATLDKKIATDMAVQLENAALVRDAAIAATTTDQQTIKNIRAEANAVYSTAYNAYKPVADGTLTSLNAQRQVYVVDLEYQINTGQPTEITQSKIDSIDVMIAVVNSQNALIDKLIDDITYSIADAYNQAYAQFDSQRSVSNMLESQATNLQNDVNALINLANLTYDENIATINGLFEEDLNRRTQVESTLNDIMKLKPQFADVINELNANLQLLNAELVNLKDIYKEAIKTKDNAYAYYLIEKAALGLLENED